MPNLENLQAIKTSNTNETSFNKSLEYGLYRLVGIHEQLNSALKQLDLIISEELSAENDKNSKPSNPQDISDRCQRLMNTLKENKELGERGFEELDQLILHPILNYANLPEEAAIPRSQFLAIIQQNLNNIFLEIQNGFRFQDEKSDQEEIKKATKAVQKRQKQIEIKQIFTRLLNPSSQRLLTVFELGGVAAVDIILNWVVPNSAIYHEVLLGSFGVAMLLELVNNRINNRTLFTNLFYTLPSALISRLQRNSADHANQNEQAPLLSHVHINSDGPINNNSYGSMNAQLVQPINAQIAQTTIATRIVPEVPSPANLDEKTEDLENTTFNSRIQTRTDGVQEETPGPSSGFAP